MLYLKLFLLLEILVIFAISYWRNRDIFSPSKIYLAYSTFFYIAIFFEPVLYETIFCYFLLIQSVGATVIFEKKYIMLPTIVSALNFRKFYKIIWLCSFPGIMAMGYMIYNSGGVVEHLSSLQYRVADWKGQGVLVIAFNMLPTLLLLYFAGKIGNPRKTVVNKLSFLAFVAVVFFIGIMTASRSYVAMPIIGVIVVWSYMIKQLRIRNLLVVVLFLIVFVSVMGALRNSKYSGESVIDYFENGFSTTEMELTHFSYGVNPLEHVFGYEEKVRLGGSTYLTLFTNFIPRSLWPNKPDTAGLIFTRLYTDDDTGMSFIATGAIAEAILNFGKPFGVFFGSVTILVLFWGGCLFYNRSVVKAKLGVRRVSVYKLVAYFFTILTIARYFYGEFTDVFQSLIFFNLLPVAMVFLLGLLLRWDNFIVLAAKNNKYLK